MDTDALPTRTVLPADNRIPAPGGERLEHPPWLDPFVGANVLLRDDRDRGAWFHFCHGHHLEFLYWEATTLTCERAAEALAEGADERAAGWIERATTLIRGSAAMLFFCGAFDTAVYDPLLRTSMAAQRDDFSGDMSSDFLTMMQAKAALVAALGRHGDGSAASVDAFRAAERFWYHRHGEVVLALHPGDSLLKEKIDDLRSRSADFDYDRYVETTVHGQQARADYDAYFGVERSASLSLEDYWTQALAKIDVVHHHFALAPDVQRVLMTGDATLLAILAEQVTAPPGRSG